MRDLRAAMALPGLRRLLVAQVPADFADWLDFVAVGALIVYGWSLGAEALAFMTLAMGLPYVLVGPVAGAMVDRTDLRLALVASNLGRSVATLSLAFAGNIGVLLVLLFVRSTADAFFTPAKQSAIQAVTPRDMLVPANGISHSINQVSKVAGPAVGGLLLAFLHPSQVFFINALLSASAALLLMGMRFERHPEVGGEGSSLLQDWRSGISEFRDKPILGLALILMGTGMFFAFLYDALIPLLAKALSFDQSVFGFAIAAAGAGGVLGGLAIGSLGNRLPPLVVMGLGFGIPAPLVIFGGAAPLMQISMHPGVFIVLFAVIGLATAAIFVPYRTLIQTESAPDKIGRTSAVGEAFVTVSALVAPFAGAALSHLLGVGWAFIIGGAALAVLGLSSAIAALLRPTAGK